MKALPSIAFSEFKGSAGSVTARVSKGRQIISAKSLHSRITTVAQAVRRCSFAAISRKFRSLSESQMAGWTALAKRLKGASVFGQSAELTPHNAFVRLNSNRKIAGMPLLLEAPDYIPDIPSVVFEDIWITPTAIIFTGLEKPSSNMVMVFKMSPSQSPGTSSGWGHTVIINPSVSPQWGEADLTKFYTSVIGYSPAEGKKYYCSFYWLDTETGFTGEETLVSSICREESVVNRMIYVPRVRVTTEMVGNTYSSIANLDMELSPNIPVANVNVEIFGDNQAASSRFDLQDASQLPKINTMYLLARSSLDRGYIPQVFQAWTQVDRGVTVFIIAHRAGSYVKDSTIDCTGFYR